jgi:hypothetical protein
MRSGRRRDANLPRLGATRQNCADSMNEADLKAELEALKAEVAQISSRRAGGERPATDAGAAETSTLDEIRKLAERADASQLVEQASEFLKGLGKDVQDSKPRALIAAFVAGFLAGRATGR